MRKFDLVAVDIDGTLLNSSHQLTENTRKTVIEAVKQGILITLSTGRMFQSAQKIAAEIGLDVPLITYNGALVRNSCSEEIIFQQQISVEIGQKMMLLLDEAGLHYHVYVDGALYVPQITEKSRMYALRTGVSVHLLPEMDLQSCSGFYKLLVMGESKELDHMQDTLCAMLPGDIKAFKSHAQYLEIVHACVSKGNALRTLANAYGIPCHRIMAIGDHYNDLEMITYAGCGVAMGNAPAEIKSCALHITTSNDDEGAAKAIQNWAMA